MPRVYQRLGEKKRCDAITALFTHDERIRIEEMARQLDLPMSVLVHKIVVRQLETQAS